MRHLLAAALVATLATVAVSPACGYFSDPLTDRLASDARSEAMGGTRVAIAEGAFATWANPGALGFARDWSLSPFSHEELYFTGWTRSYAIAGPIRRVGVGAEVTYVDLQPETEGEESSMDQVLIGAGVDALELIRHERDPAMQWGVGMALRRVHVHQVSFVPFEAAKRTYHSKAVDVDLGTVFRVERAIALPAAPIRLGSAPAPSSFYATRVAAVFEDVLRNGSDITMGRVLRGGAALETGLFGIAPLGHLVGTVIAVEVEKSVTERDTAANLKYGLEATLLGTLSVRYGEFDDHFGGAECTEAGCIPFDRNYHRSTRGLGLRMGTERASIRLDYSKSYLNRYSVTFHYTP